MRRGAAIADAPAVKGWCPGALRPMQTGDGLIVRVRPRCGALSLAQLRVLAESAGRFGNGHIDLTRRANLQIRGVTSDSLPGLWGALSDAGLMDAHADAEAVRNVMVSPLAGLDPNEALDVRPFAAALEAALADVPALWALPGKFGFVVDGGGLLPLYQENADIRLQVVHTDEGARIALGIETALGRAWLRLLAPEDACAAALVLARSFLALPNRVPRARLRALDDGAVAVLRRALEGHGAPAEACSCSGGDSRGARRVGLIEARGRALAVGLGAPFGRISAEALGGITHIAADLGASAIRLSPWRTLYVPVSERRDGDALLDVAARDWGLVATPDDPLMAIDACPGAPDCRSACADTRAAALRLAALMPLDHVSSLHVSGCAKGCARSRCADLVLVGMSGGFGIVRNGTAADVPSAFVASESLSDLPAILSIGA